MRSLLCILISMSLACGGETPTPVPSDLGSSDTSVSEDTSAPEDAAAPEDTSAPEDATAPEDISAPEDIATPEDTGADTNSGSSVCDFQCSVMVPVSLECSDGPKSIEECLELCTTWEETCPAEFTAAFECIGDGGYVCQNGNDLMSANDCNDLGDALNLCLMPQGAMCDSYCTDMVAAAEGCAEGPQTHEECINECGAKKSACPIELDNFFLCVGVASFVCDEGTNFHAANDCDAEALELDSCFTAEK